MLSIEDFIETYFNERKILASSRMGMVTFFQYSANHEEPCILPIAMSSKIELE